MKTFKEIMKTVIFLFYVAAAAADFIAIIGETAQDTTLLEFFGIKTAAIIAGYILILIGTRLRKWNATPEWWNRYTDFITTEV